MTGKPTALKYFTYYFTSYNYICTISYLLLCTLIPSGVCNLCDFQGNVLIKQIIQSIWTEITNVSQDYTSLINCFGNNDDKD